MVVAATVSLGVSPQDVRTAEAYLAHVLRYYTGDRAAAMTVVERWTASDLQRALRGTPEALERVVDSVKLGSGALVGSAMTMHTDIARHSGGSAIGLHLSVASRLADLLPAGESTIAFRAQWHVVAGTLMLGLSRPSDATRHFDAARDLRPHDPDVLLAAGSLREFEASIGRERERQDRLKKARDFYRGALSASPDLYEARLRLARTQHLLGDVTAAAATIGALDDRDVTAYLQYVTRLIRGAINESLGRMPQAVSDYRGALAICAICQSAAVALSHALLRSGDREAARVVIDRLLSNDAFRRRSDPWWGYQMAQWHDVDRMLERLRNGAPQ